MNNLKVIIICLCIVIAFALTESFFVAFITMGIFVFMDNFYEMYSKKKKFRKVIDKSTNYLFLCYLPLFLLDVYSTWLGVFHYKVGYETNEFLLFFWGNFGYWLGWIIYSATTLLIMLGLYQLKNINNLKLMNIFIFFTIIFIDLRTLLAIINNFNVIFK